ncbi:two-component system regulatory protein YycI [Virgibacillus ndiopensis]|uniref:two-component system regulatory protein YycI n=1 Tax=Virgibacillus ndiopensis TaxID=2004408 RepID=UPI000C06FE6F|nr:two-component system regulatory protein YycI [Virgibacillus ndiopensis]
MQWSQIKTLFILCFLILDIYLLYQFITKQDESDLDTLEQQNSTIEQRLKNENIKIQPELDEVNLKESYISVPQKNFTEKESTTLTGFENQSSTIINNDLIVSQFEKPIPLPNDVKDETIEETIKNYILFPDDYDFWGWNKNFNVLIFSQIKDGRPVYLNQSGMLLVFLNDNNEMSFYVQTMMGKVDDLDSVKPLYEPIQAINNLFTENYLYTDDEVTDVKIGYFTAVNVTDGTQTLAPTWKISVKGERLYFVNAIEGFVFSSDEVQFLQDSIKMIKEEVGTMEDKNDLKKEVLNELSQWPEVINRSETE